MSSGYCYHFLPGLIVCQTNAVECLNL